MRDIHVPISRVISSAHLPMLLTFRPCALPKLFFVSSLANSPPSRSTTDPSTFPEPSYPPHLRLNKVRIIHKIIRLLDPPLANRHGAPSHPAILVSQALQPIPLQKLVPVETGLSLALLHDGGEKLLSQASQLRESNSSTRLQIGLELETSLHQLPDMPSASLLLQLALLVIVHIFWGEFGKLDDEINPVSEGLWECEGAVEEVDIPVWEDGLESRNSRARKKGTANAAARVRAR